MSGTTWSKFFWSDWQYDPSLRLCSYAARGLWMDMLCIAAAHDPIGYVAVAGRGLDVTDIARMTGGSETEVASLLGELDRNGVFSRDRHGRIYSRRMISDAKKASEARKNGKKGGNPTLGKGGQKSASDNPQRNPQDNGGDKPHKPEARSQSSSVPDGTGADAPSKVDTLGPLRRRDAKTGAWRLALKVLMDRGGYSEARARPLVGKWAKAASSEQLWRACEAAWDAKTLDPVSYVTAALERITAEDADPMLHPEDWRQRKWMAEFVEGEFQWPGARGPEPGQPGCRVSPAIQREFGVEPAAPQPLRGAA